MNFPGVEPQEMIQSCALDIADRGGEVLENVSRAVNITRERARQYEVQCCAKMEKSHCAQDAFEALMDHDEIETRKTSGGSECAVNRNRTKFN